MEGGWGHCSGATLGRVRGGVGWGTCGQPCAGAGRDGAAAAGWWGGCAWFPGSSLLFGSLSEYLEKRQGWVSVAARVGNFVFELRGELKRKEEVKRKLNSRNPLLLTRCAH